MLASIVMDRAASLLNDTAKTVYSYVVQVPYMNAAVDELQESMELNNIPATNEVSSVIPVLAGAATSIAAGVYPADLVEIQGLYERTTGTTDAFLEMTKCEFLPLITTLTSSLIYWAWENQVIVFVGANVNRDVKMNYIGATVPAIVDGTTDIKLFNSKSFLAYRTASLCARFIGENPTRADELDLFALAALDRFLGINTKGRQSIPVRHRPFMARYKARGM